MVNLAGLAGGGGSVDFVREPPPADTAAVDTLGVGPAGDSLAAPDTGTVSTPAGRSRP